MFRIKKLDIYLFKRFITLFIMTFLICIFILLMQFLWKHFTDLIGKGIEISVLAEFFIYAAVTLVPMALPLAILLASLMTFGNLGENFELTAMKAAGISLFRIMRMLIIFISTVCIAAFFFSNYISPKAQTKLYTLLFSLKQKSPEFDIPVGEFYSGINDRKIYVYAKDNGLLKDLMIYDYSYGFDNATVMVADSGRIQFSKDNKYLMLTIYEGESFENLKYQKASNSYNSIPYRRETFRMKKMLIDFDTELNRMDESMLQDAHVSKNIVQLTKSIDSVQLITTDRSNQQVKEMISQHYLGREEAYNTSVKPKPLTGKLNADSLVLLLNQPSLERAAATAVQRARNIKELIAYNKIMLQEPIIYVAKHRIERHRKFTLSFACLIFFFIGAPLGAIIRKGGLGLPVVISVIMFIIYYIIDNTGYKMAREGLWEAYMGMWLSSAILLPVGVFLTYKAVVDATLFNQEEYIKIWNQIKIKYNQIFRRRGINHIL